MDIKKFILNADVQLYENKVNDGFAKIKILVNTHEQVANGTKFSRELLETKMSKLNYLPVVAEFKVDKNDFGTHGGKIELTDDSIEFIDTTKPYGVVIENSGRFEEVVKPNGETIEYVVCDGYVWVERYPELNVLFEGKNNNQSMEISIIAGDYIDGVYNIIDFEYSALCILGKDITPAFDLAKIETDFEDTFKAEYNEMINALNKYLEFEKEEVEEDIENEENMEDEVKKEVIDYEELYDDLLIEYNKLKDEYEEYKNNYSTKNDEVVRLQEFESTTLKDQRRMAEESIFEQFDEKLSGVDEYEELKEKAGDYNIDDLKKECFAILGKKISNFSVKKNNKMKIDFSKSNPTESKYGDLFEKYNKE